MNLNAIVRLAASHKALAIILCGIALPITASAEAFMQACPTWATALSSRHPDPTSAALAFYRAPNGPGCSSTSPNCIPNNFSGGIAGGKNFTAFTCEASNNCNVGAWGDQEDTGVFQFGANLHCAYFVSSGASDSRRNAGAPPCPTCVAGNPINGGTGNKYQVEVDFPRVGGLEFIRTYNSTLIGERTALGHKWRHNWDRTVNSGTGDFVGAVAAVVRGDGKGYQFTAPASGTIWIAPADIPDRLEMGFP